MLGVSIRRLVGFSDGMGFLWLRLELSTGSSVPFLF